MIGLPKNRHYFLVAYMFLKGPFSEKCEYGTTADIFTTSIPRLTLMLMWSFPRDETFLDINKIYPSNKIAPKTFFGRRL